MREKLIPFDFEAFKADPSRLRTPLGRAAEWAEAVHGYVVAHFDCDREAAIYAPCDQSLLRLAANTVKVRLYRDPYDGRIFVTDENSVDLNSCPTNWCSDIVEIPVTA